MFTKHKLTAILQITSVLAYISCCLQIQYRIRVSPRPNRQSTCLNSKFLFNYISTPIGKRGSLKYEPAMCSAFLIHGLEHRTLGLYFKELRKSYKLAACTCKMYERHAFTCNDIYNILTCINVMLNETYTE